MGWRVFNHGTSRQTIILGGQTQQVAANALFNGKGCHFHVTQRQRSDAPDKFTGDAFTDERNLIKEFQKALAINHKDPRICLGSHRQ